MPTRVTRLAPSPTGALHLGNARTFLVNWAIARIGGWRLILRIEDLDGPRVKPGALEQTVEDLRWLGIDFDGEPLIQSRELGPSREALARLAARGLAYSCDLSRKEIEAASSAPHAEEHETPYPVELRPPQEQRSRYAFDREDTNYRFVVPDRTVTIDDEIAGLTTHHPAREVGDFLLWTKRSVPSYQLAVVVDDARQGVTDVIRGDDLLRSAARQTLLYEALQLSPPRWWHLPLVLGQDGRRLAKRHGDTRVSAYRDQGVAAERVIGLLAWWSGGTTERAEISASDFRDRFNPATLSRSPVTFTDADHQWLLAGPSRSLPRSSSRSR